MFLQIASFKMDLYSERCKCMDIAIIYFLNISLMDLKKKRVHLFPFIKNDLKATS
jgi:hypothetical protein